MGSAEGEITSSRLGGAIGQGVSKVGDTAVLVGSITCTSLVGSEVSEIIDTETVGATGSRTDGSTAGHSIGLGVGLLGISISSGGIVCDLGSVGEVVGLGGADSTFHSGTSDCSGVCVIPVSDLPDVGGCRDEGIPAKGWVTSTGGGDVVGTSVGGIISSGLWGAIGNGVSSVGDTIGAVLVGSTLCVIDNAVGTGLVEASGSYIVGVIDVCAAGPKDGHGVGLCVGSLRINTGRGSIVGVFIPVRGGVGLVVECSTLHSGTCDGLGSDIIAGARLLDVDGCSDEGVPAEECMTTPVGGDVVGLAEAGITRS